MAKILIIGGSISGLATALALSEQGQQGQRSHDIEILERDPNPPPDTVEAAHSAWSRPTVPQAYHSHAFASLGVNLLLDRAPNVYAELVAAGADKIHLAERMPPTLRDKSAQPGDEDLRMLGCRRSTFELVLRRETLALPNVRVRHGTTVRGLELAANGAPRVIGARTADGAVLPADIVIDATGRRSPAAQWLADAGLPVPPGQVDSCEITYYTRHYQLLADQPPGPLNRGFGAGGLWDHYTAVLFLGDNRTFSISIGVLPDDASMKPLRQAPAFTAALQATPLLAPWLAPGAAEPISPVYAMGGLDNSLRPTIGGESPVLGFFQVGDATCTTNPAYGRGVSLALAHAYQLADIIQAAPDVGAEQAREFARATERLLTPWFQEAVQNDRGRAGLWRATLSGEQPPTPPPGVVPFGAVVQAAAVDPVVWRRLVRVMMSLDPPSTVYGDDDTRARVREALAAGPPPQMPAPTRAELVGCVTQAAA
jgi:2-polyprenyl-6-methoxyphenol hydroxylase-like FAD-dependent oxidoreductase